MFSVEDVIGKICMAIKKKYGEKPLYNETLNQKVFNCSWYNLLVLSSWLAFRTFQMNIVFYGKHHREKVWLTNSKRRREAIIWNPKSKGNKLFIAYGDGIKSIMLEGRWTISVHSIVTANKINCILGIKQKVMWEWLMVFKALAF